MIPYYFWTKCADKSCSIQELLDEFPALQAKDKTVLSGDWGRCIDRFRRWNSGVNLAASDPAMSSWPVAPSIDKWVLEDYSSENEDELAQRSKSSLG
jgi:hypothetical protein